MNLIIHKAFNTHKMKIQVGEVYMDKVTQQKTLYPNKTRKYLLACLKEYGDEFEKKINSVFKVAVGIGDIVVDNKSEKKYERHIFILLDSTVAKKFFIEFMEWIKEQPMYEDDYVYGNINKSTYHMVVLLFPEKYYDSFQTFKQGKYSEMFKDPKDFDMFNSYPEAKKVFIKEHDYRIVFTERMNTIFNSNVHHSEWEGELDFPPTAKTEKFNHHLKK